MSEPCQHEDMDEDKANREMHCLTCGYTIPITKTPAAGAASRPEGVSPEGPTPITHSEGCWAWHPTCAQDRVRKALAYLEGIDRRIAGLTDAELEAVPEKARRILRGMP